MPWAVVLLLLEDEPGRCLPSSSDKVCPVYKLPGCHGERPQAEWCKGQKRLWRTRPSMTQLQVDVMSSEASPLGLQTSLLRPHMGLPLGMLVPSVSVCVQVPISDKVRNTP